MVDWLVGSCGSEMQSGMCLFQSLDRVNRCVEGMWMVRELRWCSCLW